MWEHKHHTVKGFTDRYHVDLLVYFEMVESKEAALYRERQIKGWSRAKKIALITSFNPTWRDLTDKIQGLV